MNKFIQFLTELFELFFPKKRKETPVPPPKEVVVEEEPPKADPEPPVIIVEEEPIIEEVQEQAIDEVEEEKLKEEKLSPTVISKIFSIIDVFETGSTKQNYSKVSIFNDGPNNIKQLTLGRGLTQAGNLPLLADLYKKSGGIYSEEFKKYNWRDYNLAYSANAIQLLQKAGEDPIMRSLQDTVFNEKYWKPALKWFNEHEFELPLSMLVIYDSFIHSGSIMMFLRKRFSAKPPSSVGGDEKEWISQYVSVRDKWLRYHESRPILRNTVYRTECFREQINKNNWDLSEVVYANGVKVL